MSGAGPFLIVVIVLMVNWYTWRTGWSAVWDFTHASLKERAELFIPRLEGVLEAEDVPFKDIGPPPVRTVPLWPRWDGGYMVGRDQLRIYYMRSRGSTYVYIGPVLESNHREVEWGNGTGVDEGRR